MTHAELLVVEDDPSAREYLTLVLREKGYLIREASNGLEALVAIESQVPDLVMSDLRMPVMDGLEFLLHAKSRWPHLPVILLTVVDDVSTIVEAVQRGAANYLVKPASPSAILTAIKKSLTGTVKDFSPPPSVPEILGSTRSMVEVRRLVTLAASSDVNVLITGETGTGKELVARAIHRYSKLCDGPFVAHNCAAIPHDLFESQFFGHKRGAFTGAHEDHVGLLGQADNGILLLDELEALNPIDQAKFLRVLDDGEVRPVGSSEIRCVTVRFLAATNRDPRQLIAEKILREDLYYRLGGLEICLPPLRDRREDIPLLAHHFLGPDDGTFTPEALKALRAHAWPGNVRQLRNLVRSAKALSGKEKVKLCHLAFEPAQLAGPPGRMCQELAGPLREVRPASLQETERRAIVDALRWHQSNLSQAARSLGIDRSTLRRKIHELGIEKHLVN